MSTLRISFLAVVTFGAMTQAANVSAEVMQTSQSSSWNNDIASFTGNQNNSRCAVTGFESAPWLRLDLGEEKVVSSVQLDGGIMPGVIVRVGNNGNKFGDHGGHHNNRICRSLRKTVALDSTVLSCKTPLTGQYVSVEAFDKSGSNFRQMELCAMAVSSM